MPRFFLDKAMLYSKCITGDDANHIARSLRMKTGDMLCLCDGEGTDYDTRITEITSDSVHFLVIGSHPCPAEPNIHITLFQAYPKSDKLDGIIQKSVELGVSEIIPVLTERCVARPNRESMPKKRERLQRIALEASKQSGRGIIPVVGDLISLKEVCRRCGQFDAFFILYEAGGEPFSAIIPEKMRTAAVLIGPEGGFSSEEVKSVKNAGGKVVSLGKRILRTETAPIAALSILEYVTGNLE